jgi:hypothetical protein
MNSSETTPKSEAPKEWQRTSSWPKGLLRHKTGNYYLRTYAKGKATFTPLKTDKRVPKWTLTVNNYRRHPIRLAVSRSGGGFCLLPAVARTADARQGEGDPRPSRRAGGLARPGCARLRGRPVSRAQRGPRRSLQDGHDSAGGSVADGGRDVPARILSERRLYAAFLPRGPFPGRVTLHRTEHKRGRKQGS